jgi:hypothetical protein
MSCGLCLLFWCSLFVIAYPYVIYPLLLIVLNGFLERRLPAPDRSFEPSITVICPIHNEAGSIAGKIENLLGLEYPPQLLEILIVGDGCTDESLSIARRAGGSRVKAIDLPRAGKAAALNAGLNLASGDVVVFTDAGIHTGSDTLRALAGHFANPAVGCVSGEDRIRDGSGEGLYGRLELRLRREEARLCSIAGASGCLYAARRLECKPFKAGMAPDFLSVLEVVRAGKRALCEPMAHGYMSATSSPRGEFARKKRTILRGMTALFANAALLSPFKFPAFSFILVSHKVLRWLAPLALVGALIASMQLRDHFPYRLALQAQVVMYVLAFLGLAAPGLSARWFPIRICAFFVLVNAAAAAAFTLWMLGVRQEVWEPTRRST